MNRVAEEIRSYYGIATGEALEHYGIKKRSGRYPWGSGDNPYQHSGDWLSRVEYLRKSGMNEDDIANEFELTSYDMKLFEGRAKHERKMTEYAHIKSLKTDGYSTAEIAKMTGKNESTIRSMLDPSHEERLFRADKTADILKKELETKEAIDVGKGVEHRLGVSRGVLDEACLALEIEGYGHFGIGLKNPTDPNPRGHQTTVDILTKPDGPTQRDCYKDPGIISEVGEFHSVDGGRAWSKREYPASIDSDRVYIKYGDAGGNDKDGVIEIRPGVADLNLGNSHYAQVRIMVDGTHYLKGMAIYSDDIPEGKDIVFNTNKATGTPKEKVFKEISVDPENPFGAYIKADGQSYYDDPKGKYTDPVTGKKQSLSAINKLKEEGDYNEQSRTVSSQFLSKQPIQLIRSQLDISYKDYESQYEEICSLTNPALKKKMLKNFADQCDTASWQLKAAAFPRQRQQVLLPAPDLKDNEVYAPNYRDGETVALVRYPHAGIFEIPILTVNNRDAATKKYLGDVQDAVGVNKNVANQLSGADNDGDTVTVIPVTDKVRINSKKPFKELQDFDAKTEYFVPEEQRQSKTNPKGTPIMTKSYTQKQMGLVSNLITDMTLQGATDDELIRAVKHSMVVIDAAKHKLDYKRSEIDNNIAALKAKYQAKTDENGDYILDKDGNTIGGGAKTLLSKRKQTVQVDERKGSPRIDKETGELVYKTSGRTYVDKKTGEVKEAKTDVKLLVETKDLRTLSTGTDQENAYADYGNKLKALAAKARLEYTTTPNMKMDASAKETYAEEVASLNSKLKAAEANKPLERRAKAIASSRILAKTQQYPELLDKENAKLLRKIKQTEMDNARAEVGSKSKETKIVLTDREWAAIQAGAVSHSRSEQIFNFCDQDNLRQRALPKATTTLSAAKIGKIQSLARSGNYTRAEIADMLGVSVTTVSEAVNGEL
jgi:hypothetical protein